MSYDLDEWMERNRKLRAAFERAGIRVYARGGDGLTKLLGAISPPNGKPKWRAVVERDDYGNRYVMHVQHRVSGHKLRVNQRSRQFDHDWKVRNGK